MDKLDPFAQNILGAQNLVGSEMNKTRLNGNEEVGELLDVLELPMTDEACLELRDEWVSLDDKYSPKIKPRQEANKVYYEGKQLANGMAGDRVVTSNLIFEAEETFIPQALSKNPEPVVWSDNTEEGKLASNDIKTMLQFHADILCLRKKLGVMVRHWSIYFVGVLKHGWDEKTNDIKTEIRKPQNFRFDPDGYVDEFGNYCGAFLGEKIKSTAKQMIEMFPKKKAEIIVKCDGKLGTPMTYTEWWTDEYCFSTFEDIVLDKHKNEFFDYGTPEETNEFGSTNPAIKGQNHFATPKMPYTFLSVFSLQEHPHDVTTLIEQNISNQDSINDWDLQISKNLRNGNNSIALSGLSFNQETARQAAQALEDGDPVLVPDGQVENAIKRLPAAQLPPGLMDARQMKEATLRGVFGTNGITPNQEDRDMTARGMILNQSNDNTRIGGGVGDALEQVADNVFNWWLQLYYVFYDEKHYAAIMGSGRAVEYIELQKSNLNNRRFVVSVSAGSMKPKDELAEVNEAIELWSKQALDPITLFKRINDPDPIETAKRVAMWITNPQLYMMTNFPEAQPMVPQDSANPQNALDIQPQQPAVDQSLSAEPASASLSNVPLT